MQDVPLDLIDPAGDNPRESVGDVSDLAETIRRYGILQPLVLLEKPDGRYLTVAGHRRAAAARLAGLDAVPATVRPHGTEQERLAMMVVENVHRENLTRDERMALYARLHDEFGLNNRQIGELVGKSQSHVGQTLLMLKGEDVREAELRDVRVRRLRGEVVMGRPLADASAAAVVRKLKESDPRFGTQLTHEQAKTALGLIEVVLRAAERRERPPAEAAA